MRSLLSIIGRNIKIFSRSKLSTFIVLVAPILLVFLVGTAFSTNSISDVKLGVYSSEYSELTNSIIASFEGNQFNVIRLDSEEDWNLSDHLRPLRTCFHQIRGPNAQELTPGTPLIQ